jgi:hypothetical protein
MSILAEWLGGPPRPEHAGGDRGAEAQETRAELSITPRKAHLLAETQSPDSNYQLFSSVVNL